MKLSNKERKANYQRYQNAIAVYLTKAGWTELVSKSSGLVSWIDPEPSDDFLKSGLDRLPYLTHTALEMQISRDLELSDVVEKTVVKKAATKKKPNPLPKTPRGKCGIG